MRDEQIGDVCSVEEGNVEPGLRRNGTNGLCHQLPESDYTNNQAVVLIFIPAHPGRQGAGPLAGNTDSAIETDCHDGGVNGR